MVEKAHQTLSTCFITNKFSVFTRNKNLIERKAKFKLKTHKLMDCP